jgi:type II secretory pathway component PulM
MATHSSVERRIAVALAILVAIAVLWTALWQPMTRDAASLRVARAVDAAALARAREMTKEIGELARAAPKGVPTDARADLDRALLQQNLRPAVTSVDWRDGRAHMVLAGVGYDALIVALEALQRDTRLRAVEATITARVEPGTVRAELTLAR